MEMIVGFIDERRGDLGVEPICTQLQVAPSTYYAAKSRPPSARAQRDAVLLPILVALWTANFKVYGVRKLWRAARRDGQDVGRDQVARLMRLAGIEGIRKGRKVRTTKGHGDAARAPDLVKRNFTAERPNQLWVSDLTYVATWSGFAYVCFIVDAFSRMIVGWRVASNMKTDMVLDAVEMAAWRRATTLTGLVAHSDQGSQYTSLRYGERLAELGATPSVGSVGDAFDNALAENVNGLYKAELIRGPGQGPWRTVEDVELATLSWVHWYNETRLHEYLNYLPPAEYEAEWAKANTCTSPCGPQSPSTEVGGSKGPAQPALVGAVGSKD